MSEQLTSTKDLKRVLGRKELMSIGIGQTIGSGIFALTGIGIAMTGKSISIAMIIAAFFVITMLIPMMFVAGTIRLRGGFYTQLGLLCGERFSGFFVIVHILANISLAMYALSFADYFISLIPGTPHKLIAVLILTTFYIANFFGINGAAKLQNIMTIVMGSALLVFILYGFSHIQPGYFSQPDFMTGGISGLFAASALMTWACGGASVIIHLGAEAKNPTKDIPIVLFSSTLLIAVFYAFIGAVASGVLPLSEVANQNLSLVAKTVLPNGVLQFFILGGAMFALTTTLNASFGWVTKSVLQASIDGWFPKKLGAIHHKYKTPHIILTLFYIVGLLPIFFSIPIGTIASSAVILNNVLFVIICFSAIRMPSVIPEIWNKSRFHVNNSVLIIFSTIGGLATAAQIYLLFDVLTPTEIFGNVAVCIIALVFSIFRHRSGKVNMEISYEDA